MTAISSAGSSMPYRLGASQASISAQPGASAASIRQSAAADLPTRFTLGQRDDRGAVYSEPSAKPGVVHVWASKGHKNDTVSALMARNREMGSYSLRDQWRGLGGALLTRFGQTGADYAQTLVNDRTAGYGAALEDLPPEDRAQRAAAILEMQAADIANVENNASTAGLTIQTRSGQSVELKISVNPGLGDIAGMKVELKASGPMSPEERAAVAQLSDGLDRALEGLGRDDAVGLDLSGLMSYDRKLIASVDLKANNQMSHQVLGTFALHLGDDKQSITLKGSDGELALNVNTATSLESTPALQRHAAIQRTLDRMDSAGERGQANAALLAQMKSAFKAFQTATRDGDESTTDVKGKAEVLADQNIATPLSGLADFDASFGGETYRRNRFGSTHQAGQVQYQLSQQTKTTGSNKGSGSVAQTVSEQLSADFRQATAPDGMLDVRTGQYSTTKVRDRSTVTTLVESAAERVTRVLRKTDEDQLKTVTDAQGQHTPQRQFGPLRRSFLERLH